MQQKLVRVEQWPTILAKFMEERRYAPFEWGSNDCCLFTGDAILAITGVDLAADFRGKYHDARGAFRAVKKFAGGGIEELVLKITEEHGIEQIGLPFVQRGDIVMADVVLPYTLEVHPSLGIGVGINSMFVSERGLSAIPTLACRAAWKV